MRLLSYSDIGKVSGGATSQEMIDSMAQYSFSFASLGAVASGLYAICTNTTVMTTTLSGSTITVENSFSQVFWIGVGVSWVVGALVGFAVANYSSSAQP